MRYFVETGNENRTLGMQGCNSCLSVLFVEWKNNKHKKALSESRAKPVLMIKMVVKYFLVYNELQG